MSALEPPVTYNQVHTPRKQTPGQRRISIYWAWSYPWEAGRDPADIENRFSTMTEVRIVAWPAYETPDYGPAHFIQGIAGTLELFHRSTMPFQIVAGEATGHPVAVFQRIDQAGRRLPIDERVLADTDTLLIFGLTMSSASRKPRPRKSTPSGSGCNAKAPVYCWLRTTTSARRTITTNAKSNSNITATPWCHASSGSANTPAQS